MPKFTTLTSTVFVLPIDHIDTDQIIPARFLKATDKSGMGEALFSDWRYLADGSPNPAFALNQADLQGSEILLAGDNFGCGSSREHAPWALTGFGLRAVLSTSFADIFRNNALKNGLLPVVIQPETYHRLLEWLKEDPQARLTIHLEEQALILPDGSAVAFPIDPFARACLLQGVDELGYLLSFSEQIAAYESRN